MERLSQDHLAGLAANPSITPKVRSRMLHPFLPKAQMKGEGHKDTWHIHIRYTANDTLLDIAICGGQGPFTLHCPAYMRHDLLAV